MPPGRRHARTSDDTISTSSVVTDCQVTIYSEAISKKCDQGEKDPATTETQIRRKRTGSQNEDITDMNVHDPQEAARSPRTDKQTCTM